LTSFKPLLGLLILAVPVLVIWFLFRKSKGPRTGNPEDNAWSSMQIGGGSDGGEDGSQ
jgi:hypothetical protein